jgi:hypothetical protein
MKGEDSTTGGQKRGRGPGFRIAGGPVASDQGPSAPYAEAGQLPSNYGTPILFAIPRDPRTIFTYWNINWSEAFVRNEPVDRQVYLRLKRRDGSDEVEEPVEPMLGSHFLMVAQPKGAYQVELGFYDSGESWNSIAASDLVTMPADSSSENSEVDLATVPFHLSFQRMIDMFRTTNGDAIASVLSRMQGRAAETGDELSDEEREILRAMNLSVADLEEARRGFGGRSADDLLRKRAEAVLGFGGTSPSGGPGGSSWS